MVEKRKSPRVPVSIKVDSPQNPKFIFGYARDISMSGMAVCAEVVNDASAIPSIGDQLQLSFILPEQNTKVTVQGKVVRLDLYDDRLPIVGLTFHNLAQEFQHCIAGYISKTQLASFDTSREEI
jgi:hypothetical protein